MGLNRFEKEPKTFRDYVFATAIGDDKQIRENEKPGYHKRMREKYMDIVEEILEQRT